MGVFFGLLLIVFGGLFIILGVSMPDPLSQAVLGGVGGMMIGYGLVVIVNEI